MILVACTRVAPQFWKQELRSGWTEIIHIPFPYVPAESSLRELEEWGKQIADQLMEALDEQEGYITVEGALALTVMITRNIQVEKLAFPIKWQGKYIGWRTANNEHKAIYKSERR